MRLGVPLLFPFPRRLEQEGLSLPWDASYYAMLAGTSGQSVEEYVAGLKAAKAEKEAR